MYIIRFLTTMLFLCMPVLSQAAESADSPWRLGIGAGAFAVTAKPIASPNTYHKVLPAYQASISYSMLPDTAQGFFLPNLEAGLLVSGGKKTYAHKGTTTVLLEMPTLIQLFARVAAPLDAEWNIYGMLSLGMFKQQVSNSRTTLITSNRVAALGIGGGFSRKINTSYALDMGAFMPGIVLSKGNQAFSEKIIGVILNLRYSF